MTDLRHCTDNYWQRWQSNNHILIIVFTSGAIDYANYFIYNPLASITGEPNYEHLKKLKKQLKANTKAVPSTLKVERMNC